jgi:hypothetical protein
VALQLLREYAPERPVRLLGVRVAGLAHGAATSANESSEAAVEKRDQVEEKDQLELPV